MDQHVVEKVRIRSRLIEENPQLRLRTHVLSDPGEFEEGVRAVHESVPITNGTQLEFRSQENCEGLPQFGPEPDRMLRATEGVRYIRGDFQAGLVSTPL